MALLDWTIVQPRCREFRLDRSEIGCGDPSGRAGSFMNTITSSVRTDDHVDDLDVVAPRWRPTQRAVG